MRANSPRWHAVGKSAHDGEGAAQDHVRDLLPDSDPYQGWTNIKFVGGRGAVREVDLLLLTPLGFYLVEIKSFRGRVSSSGGWWTHTKPSGACDTLAHPLILANDKAQELKSRLLRARGKLGLTVAVPWVQPAVFLSDPDLVCDLEPDARTWVFGPYSSTGDGLPGVAELWTPGSDRRGNRRRRGPSGAFASALPALLEQIGVGVLPERSTASRASVDGGNPTPEPVATGPGWREHDARDGTAGRVRVYLTAQQTDPQVRRAVDAMAHRHHRTTERLRHPGILAADRLEQLDDGPALHIPRVGGARRLDRHLAETGSTLGTTARLDLVRQLVEVLAYAHSRGVAHRYATPGAVLVTPPTGGTRRVQVGDWQYAGPRDAADPHDPPTSLLGLDGPAGPYLAPEREEADRPAALDVFGVGALAHLVLTGRAPAANRGAMLWRLAAEDGLLLGPTPAPPPPGLAELLRWATRPAVDARLPSMARFAAELARITTAATEPAPTEPAPTEPARVAPRPRPTPTPRTGDSAAAVVPGAGPGAGSAATDPWKAGPGDRLDGGLVVRRVVEQDDSHAGRTRTLLVSRTGPKHAVPVDRDHDRLSVLRVAETDRAAARLDREAANLRRLPAARTPLAFAGPLLLGGRTVLEVEHVAGPTLRDVLRQQLPADRQREQLRRWGTDLLAVLADLGAAQVYHRDITPERIVVRHGDDGAGLVLVDFSQSSVPLTETGVGRSEYREYHSARHDRAAERYAVVQILHEMAAGRLPWDDHLSRDRTGPFPAGIDVKLAAFFERARHPSSNRRFGDAETMRTAWERVFEDEPAPPPPPAPPPTPRRVDGWVAAVRGHAAVQFLSRHWVLVGLAVGLPLVWLAKGLIGGLLGMLLVLGVALVVLRLVAPLVIGVGIVGAVVSGALGNTAAAVVFGGLAVGAGVLVAVTDG